jgi:hypothetical protein
MAYTAAWSARSVRTRDEDPAMWSVVPLWRWIGRPPRRIRTIIGEGRKNASPAIDSREAGERLRPGNVAGTMRVRL